MFKDLYKNANDKIPTEDAYLRVMERVAGESKKSKYPYIKVAALAACFILTVAMVSVYESNKHSKQPPMTPVNIVTETIPSPVAEQEAIKPKVTVKPQAAVAPKPESTKIVYNQGLPEGTGVSVARFTLEGEVVTSDMYKKYLGKDVEAAVLLPEGFENQSPEEQILVLEGGESFNDQWTYYFEDEESSIFINTSKKTDNVKNVLANTEYEKSDILGCDVVIFSEEMQKTAFFENESIGYAVTGMNVSDSDFETLLKSLVK